MSLGLHCRPTAGLRVPEIAHFRITWFHGVLLQTELKFCVFTRKRCHVDGEVFPEQELTEDRPHRWSRICKLHGEHLPINSWITQKLERAVNSVPACSLIVTFMQMEKSWRFTSVLIIFDPIWQIIWTKSLRHAIKFKMFLISLDRCSKWILLKSSLLNFLESCLCHLNSALTEQSHGYGTLTPTRAAIN